MKKLLYLSSDVYNKSKNKLSIIFLADIDVLDYINNDHGWWFNKAYRLRSLNY